MAFWVKNDRKILQRIFELFKNTIDNPYQGIGKPEPLRRSLKGYWSRRINKEHRIIYTVTDEAIIVISCRSHYDI